MLPRMDNLVSWLQAAPIRDRALGLQDMYLMAALPRGQQRRELRRQQPAICVGYFVAAIFHENRPDASQARAAWFAVPRPRLSD